MLTSLVPRSPAGAGAGDPLLAADPAVTPAHVPAGAPSSLGHRPAGPRWSFDDGVTACFADMLARSIPDYANMRDLCFRLGRRYVRPHTAIIDAGASLGDGLDPFVRAFGAQNRFVAVEVAPPMLAALRRRFDGYIRAGVVEVLDTDLRVSFPSRRASLVLFVLSLQFVPIEHRAAVIARAASVLEPGGALILVEKVLGGSAALDAALAEEHLALKERAGYGREEIERKRLSLEGVLVPLAASWNEALLRANGFGAVEPFWRALNFAGWLAVKG